VGATCAASKELLPLLKVKHADWEISFRLEKAEQEAKALTPVSDAAPPTPEELNRFEQIAKISPRAAVLESRVELEEAVRTFAHSVGMNENRPSGFLTRDLRKNELIDQHTSAILDDLRVVGNSAAHRLDTEISLDEAIRTRNLSERVIKQLQILTEASTTLGRSAPLPRHEVAP
jgi:hypothetical protein